MKYKIISDTACDLSKEMEKEFNISYVPFKITVEGYEYVDDDTLNIEGYLKAMLNSKNPIKTACPGPYEYLNHLKNTKEDNIFILTISKKLSGSYNSAAVAVDEFKKEYPDKNVYIVDSQAASAGQTSVLLKMIEVLDKAEDFNEAVNLIEEKIKSNFTFFVLESLDNLIKNGRIKRTSGLIANILNIRPVMEGKNGEISLFEMNRGFKRSIMKLADALGSVCNNFEERILVISHVNRLDMANELKEKVKNLYNFKDIIIVHTKGLSSGYADNGGIVIGF